MIDFVGLWSWQIGQIHILAKKECYQAAANSLQAKILIHIKFPRHVLITQHQKGRVYQKNNCYIKIAMQKNYAQIIIP